MTGSENLSRLVAAIAMDGFGVALMRVLSEELDADMCSAFAHGDTPTLIVAESRDARHSVFAHVASLRYANVYWNRDTATQANLGRAHGSVLVARRASRSIRDLEYRLECYGAGEVGDRLSIMLGQGPTSYTINAYRMRDRTPFSGDAIDQVCVTAPILIAALARHHALSDAAALPSQSGLADRLRRLSPELSTREAQILAELGVGSSEAELASSLSLRPSTVATYRKRGYAKLGISRRRQLRDLLKDDAQPVS
ncbi:helix-turn-helix transcriptional regulator [Puniceibacterium sp. IMCC21224]|uniref:helix-turn-helix transcriptional regulator n=1 Tax=Puniceibacterium sp. IMCC21224 TaxID=1618204 RepID=UPI00064DE3D3|nr:helix-turn-helix transcriptional regulator [Puniceibacterium sp. IMCC21224]KMK68483.1 transcriptional regulator, luxR family [Puniceibacterium sp. IMCC21224]